MKENEIYRSEQLTPQLEKMIKTFYASFENPDLLEEVLDKDFVDHMPFNPNSSKGLEGFRKTVEAYREVFSDFNFEFKGIYIDGDKVIVRSLVSVKHIGNFVDIEATNRLVSFHATDIYTVKNNKIIEGWHVESFLNTYLSLLSDVNVSK